MGVSPPPYTHVYARSDDDGGDDEHYDNALAYKLFIGPRSPGPIYVSGCN